jgi:prolyl-tRNA editing enzyme YbaK/EbsC (Cys-tRNA(Pro) deacylase)
MTSLDHPSISMLSAALRQAGMSASADRIRVLDGEVRTAVLAAKALGVDVGAIANSLMFRATCHDRDQPLLVLTSGAHRADTARLAVLVGADRITKADPAYIREHTGQAIGGVSPVGHPRPLDTLVDRHLARYSEVWAAAGHPKAVFPITFADLVMLTNGTAADVAGQEDDGPL